jgi:signal transduction histidine kinase
MTLDTASSALRKADPDRAGRLVGSAVEQARAAVGDVRRLVHGLRPPALDELGLVAALRASGPAAAAGGPAVVIEADDELDALPAAVEVAAYRIAQEAMTNAVRHAGATRIAVSVRRVGPALVVEVVDDGRGIAPDASRGVGLASMRERAGELGGSLEVAAVNGRGTRVRAALPASAVPHAVENS